MKTQKRKLEKTALKEEKAEETEGKKLWQKVFKKVKGKLFKKNVKKPVKKSKSIMEKTLEQVEMLLSHYNDFIKKDFLIILSETQAVLQQWKNQIHNLMGKGDSLEQITSLNADLEDVRKIYNESEMAISSILTDCMSYQNIINNSKNLVYSISKQNNIQSQLQYVIKNLKKGLEITNIEHNSDYKFLNEYLSKNKSTILSR